MFELISIASISGARIRAASLKTRLTRALSTDRGELRLPTVTPMRNRPQASFSRHPALKYDEWTRNALAFLVLAITPKSAVRIRRRLRDKPNFFRLFATAILGRAASIPLEGENVTALGAATIENTTAALGAGADQEAVRAGALDLGRLIGTFRSHDDSLLDGKLPSCNPQVGADENPCSLLASTLTPTHAISHAREGKPRKV